MSAVDPSVTRRPGGSQIIPEPAHRRPGPVPPWWDVTADLSLSAVLARLERNISSVGATSSPRADERISAVMAVLVEGDVGAEVLLTRRSSTLNNHRGEISFPGGRADEGESIVEAARRETFEEVGIDVADLRVHSELSPLSTFVSRSYIVPVIASLPYKPDLRLNAYEVDRAFWVPLTDLVRSDTYAAEIWAFGGVERFEGRPTEQAMHFFYLDDETVWGATARMLHELLSLVHT